MKKLAVLTALAGCKKQAAQKPPVDQSRICIYSNDEEARKCVNGELSFFNPTRWGNEQLSLFVVAQYCDTNYNITCRCRLRIYQQKSAKACLRQRIVRKRIGFCKIGFRPHTGSEPYPV